MIERMAFDQASKRSTDANGFLHVAVSHISKEAVNDYYGSEIPGWQDLGLDPNRIYRGYRPAAELARAATTFNGLPLLSEHVKDSADEPQKDLRIGNLGTDAAFRAPYLDNSLIIQDAAAIAALSPTGPGQAVKRELSASYRYDPVFEPGVFNGQPYDFVMTNIRGNHVALVEEGRAGPDVVVADENTITKRQNTMDENMLAQLKAFIDSAFGKGAPAPEGEVKVNDSAVECDDNVAAAQDVGTEDFCARLLAYIEGMEDQELASKMKDAIEAVNALGAPTAPAQDKCEQAADEGEDNPAMDILPKRPAKRRGKKTPVTYGLAVDENAIAANIRAGLKEQIKAARDVRPLVGELDPMAFDSAAGIYQKALGMIGRPTKVSDIDALREMCALACETKQSSTPYPAFAAALANDSGAADPNFANLGNIRKA